MIIRSFDDSDVGGFDPRNYAPIGVTSSYQALAFSTSYTTDMSITGEGFLKRVIYGDYSNTSFNFSLKITVDGVLVVNVVDTLLNGSSSVNYYAGIYEAVPELLSSSSQLGVLPSAVDLASLPYNGPLILLPTPLFFKSSCLIEIRAQTSGGSASGGFTKAIVGGLLT